MAKQGSYYYGDSFDARILQELSYPQALYRKTMWAQELLDELLDEPRETRDYKRINQVLKSMQFNLDLIDEVYGRVRDV